MDKSVKELLAETDTPILEEYARAKRIHLANDPSRADIIEALLKNLAEDEIRKDLSLAPTYLDLRQLEVRLKQLLSESAKQPTGMLLEQLQQVIATHEVRELPTVLGRNLDGDASERLDRFRRVISARLKDKVTAAQFQKELDSLGERIDLERSLVEKQVDATRVSLTQEIDRARTDLGKRAEEGKSAVDKRFDDMKERFGDMSKGVQILQWIFGILAVVLTLGATIGAILGGRQLANIQETVANFQRTQFEVDKLKDGLTVTDAAQKQAIKDLETAQKQAIDNLAKQNKAEADLFMSYTEFFVQVMWEDCQHNLEGISLATLDAKAFDSIRRNNDIIDRIIDNAKTYSISTDEIKIVNIFKRVNVGILTYRQFLGANRDKDTKAHALKALVDAWKDKLTDGMTSGGKYDLMRRQLDANWSNVRGVIEIQKYLFNPEAYPASLNDADEFFKAALSDREVLFARPYSNRTVVNDCKFDKLSNDPESSKRKLDLITESQALLQEAAKYPASSRSQSITYNNIATWHFRKCDVLLDLENHLDKMKDKHKIKAINDLLMDGRDAVTKALSQPNRVPTAFITRADLECTYIKLLKKTGETFNAKEELEKVLHDIDTAVKEGYPGYEQYNGEQFLKKYSHYKILFELDSSAQVKQRLFQIARVAAK